MNKLEPTIYQASTNEDLISQPPDETLPPLYRNKEERKESEELWIIKNYLNCCLVKINPLNQPVTIIHHDRPDFSIKMYDRSPTNGKYVFSKVNLS